MTQTYPSRATGLLLLDPYNDFLSEGGKLWPLVAPVAEAVGLLDNLRKIVAAARAAGIRVFIVPHHRWRQGDYATWQHPNPSQLRADKMQLFAADTWGGTWHSDFEPQPGDVVIAEHWSQSGFANTDLDHQLKQHGIGKIVLIGMLANSCIESTGRFGMELGYHVTLVTDATAAFAPENMHAAHAINGPTYAHAITDTAGIVAAFQAGG
jgi:nicotinamidase-related amidase